MSDMFNFMNGSCPYQNWTSVARERCPNPDNFHCLKDEYGRIGWICSQSIWVEKDRCPIYNVGAKKMDTKSCSQTRCPPYNYRSNDVHVEYACKYIMDREISTTPFTTKSAETNKNNSGKVIILTMLSLFTIIVIVTGILILKYRRKSSKSTESRPEESKDLMQETAIDTRKTTEGLTNSSDQAKHLVVISEVQRSDRRKSSRNIESRQEESKDLIQETAIDTRKTTEGLTYSSDQAQHLVVISEVHGSGRLKSLRNIESRQEESKDLMQENAIDTLTTTTGTSNSFDQAKHLLLKERMVVITGVQGSGKTYLAKSLVNSLLQDGQIVDSFSISILTELYFGQAEKMDLYIIDDIFYELQLYEKFKETLKALTEFLDDAKREKRHLIITIPSYTWKCHGYEFDAKFDKVKVDLDNRKESEKLTILENIKADHDLPRDVLERLGELQNELMNIHHECIGFPALVSLMCKQSSVEKLQKCLCCPLETIRDEILSMRNALTSEKRGNYLVLSYMCLKDGKMNVKNIDKKLFDSLKNKYAFEFEMDLRECCEGMVGYYVLTEVDGCYEFESNILKKIVFVSIAKESTTFVKDNCKNDYLRYVIEREDICPRDVDKWYTECFTRG